MDMTFSIRDEWQLLEISHPVDEFQSGIYFLFKDQKVVYVGKSLNASARIYDHQRAKSKVFDSYAILPVAAEYLDELEVIYICKFAPIYNVLLARNSIYAHKGQLREMLNLSGPKIKRTIKDRGIQGIVIGGKMFYKISDFGEIP